MCNCEETKWLRNPFYLRIEQLVLDNARLILVRQEVVLQYYFQSRLTVKQYL